MHFSTIALPLLALATPLLAQDFTPTTTWGYWIISNARTSIGPAALRTNFNFDVRYYSQSTSISCGNSFPDDNSLKEVCSCTDSALTCEFGEDIGVDRSEITLTQRLFQRGAIATIRGSGQLSFSCQSNPVSGGSNCTAPDTPINVTEIATTLPKRFLA